jgi:hypothetical protein
MNTPSRPLWERGVMFMEQMFLEHLSRDQVYEFAFIAASLKLRGASGSPMARLRFRSKLFDCYFSHEPPTAL